MRSTEPRDVVLFCLYGSFKQSFDSIGVAGYTVMSRCQVFKNRMNHLNATYLLRFGLRIDKISAAHVLERMVSTISAPITNMVGPSKMIVSLNSYILMFIPRMVVVNVIGWIIIVTAAAAGAAATGEEVHEKLFPYRQLSDISFPDSACLRLMICFCMDTVPSNHPSRRARVNP